MRLPPPLPLPPRNQVQLPDGAQRTTLRRTHPGENITQLWHNYAWQTESHTRRIREQSGVHDARPESRHWVLQTRSSVHNYITLNRAIRFMTALHMQYVVEMSVLDAHRSGAAF